MPAGPSRSRGSCSFFGSAQERKPLSNVVEGEALLFQLALRPLMPVQAPGGVAADLQEDRPEVLVVNVKVVVIDVDRLVAIIVERAALFAGGESLGFLLGHANEHHLVTNPALSAPAVGDFVLALPVPER